MFYVMAKYIRVIVFSLFFMTLSIGCSSKDGGGPAVNAEALHDSISEIVADYPGEIGVALIVNGTDTVTVNDANIYPMMSVFKLHQALAVCKAFDNNGLSLDTVITMNRNELDPKTWSPMMREHSEPEICLPVKDLLRYTLIYSDNNASNVMFKTLVSADDTDRFIATLLPRESFKIAYTEEDMSADHDRAYANSTSPLAAAMLVDRLFTDSLVSNEKQHFVMTALSECKTGTDRIAAPLLGKDGVTIAHKTGSGYINDSGVLVAHNDVAYVNLPNGVAYSLAVFVKDFKGGERQAAEVIAHISSTVYSQLSRHIE